MQNNFKKNLILSIKIGFFVGLVVVLIFFIMLYSSIFTAADIEFYILPYVIIFMQPGTITNLICDLFNISYYGKVWAIIQLFVLPISYAGIAGLGYYLASKIKGK